MQKSSLFTLDFVFWSSAFFQCYVCHASVSVEIDRGRIAEPALCRNCNTNHSMVLIHNRSQYTDKQITKLQESPGKKKHLLVVYLSKLRLLDLFVCNCTYVKKSYFSFIYSIIQPLIHRGLIQGFRMFRRRHQTLQM